MKVSLWIRIKTADGKRPYCRLAKNKSGWALVNGKPERHLEDGVYHLHYSLRGKQTWEAVGREYSFAEAKRKMREGELELNQGSTTIKAPARLTLTNSSLAMSVVKRSGFLSSAHSDKDSYSTRRT